MRYFFSWLNYLFSYAEHLVEQIAEFFTILVGLAPFLILGGFLVDGLVTLIRFLFS